MSCTFMETPQLPPYSPSTAAPLYHAEASPDERVLDYAARTRRRPTPDWTFIKSIRGISVILTEQEQDVSVPTYSRHGTVKGTVLLEDELLHSVSIKLVGRQYLSADSGSTAKILFNKSTVIWSKAGRKPCEASPLSLPFQVQFPETFTDGKETHPLPPTLVIDSSRIPGVIIRCEYTLTITVTKIRFGLKRHRELDIPVKYYPRSRPYLPIGCELEPFLSTVKCAPADWYQVTSTMQTRKDATIGNIDAHLFIPSVKIYAISDTIPFHLQLQGSSAALNAFLFSPDRSGDLRRAKTLSASLSASQPTSSFPVSLPLITRASSNPLLPEPPPCPLKPDPSLPWYADMSRGKPVVRVYLLRQILVKVDGRRSWRNIVLGEGKLYPVTAQYYACPRTEITSGPQALDWEGELRCNGDVTIGGFNSGSLVVKDFIMMELKPASPESSPLLEHQYPHPIRLVTDTYSES